MDGPGFALSLGLQDDVFVALCAFVRVGAALQATILFSMRSVPVSVRVGLAAVLAWVVAAGTPVDPTLADWDVRGLSAALASEAMLGVGLGLAVRVMFAALDVAGAFMGINAGFAIATQFDPLAEDQQVILARLVQVAAMTAFLAADLHHQVLLGLLDSFEAAPPGRGLLAVGAARDVSALYGRLLLDAARIAMPVVAAVLFLNVVAALVTRFASQMNVYFSVGLTVNAGAGLFATALALPAVVALVWTLGAWIRPLSVALTAG